MIVELLERIKILLPKKEIHPILSLNLLILFSKRMRINYRSFSHMTQQSGYNKPGFWTFIVVLLGNLVFFMYLSFLHPGVKEHSLHLPTNTQAK
ncbi:MULTISPECIES: hypothetical protein [Leptospira]|nr:MULTISPECIES: hypothetical protein [Leptospira]ANH02106.1 Uncharacterized protein LB4E_2935 [Leptospira borgpetersenii str. 4E]EMN14174.1 hypothetical protein LEP1GSC055_2240 [Leptospira borgpetersenii str. Brem 307]ALO27912.1 hypothetical protein LBBP_03743 [Leptospira borgpetersenii serovar Ballum]AMX57114.1 hypothetical protein LBK6_01490 [Leptospira borgpetersenii serovar Hardjo]AMX60345.1 hypothetical protein LBK9_01490 [Leptospira borgpetersenii serovar Hardjo]